MAADGCLGFEDRSTGDLTVPGDRDGDGAVGVELVGEGAEE